MASQNADPRQSQEELEKLLSALEEDNRKLEIDLSAQNKKIVNISAFRADTRRAMAEELVRLETERDNLLDELQKLEKDNERYTRELEEHDRRSRDRQELEIVSNSDVEELERKNAQLTEEIRGIEHKIEILISTIAALTTTIQMTEKITLEYGSELEDQRKKLNVITNEIAFKEFEIQKYENGIKIMDDDAERKTAELRKAELENSSLEESIKKDEIQVKTLRALIEEHKKTEQQIERDFEIARLEFASVMNERQAEIEDVKAQIVDLQTKLNYGKADEEKNEKGVTKKLQSLRKRVVRIFRRTRD